MFLTIGSLVGGGPLSAEICTMDVVPSAALLVPYFEVDLESASGITTLIEITNTSSEYVVVHVVVWSNLAIPVVEFNIPLTGYDSQTINMRDVVNGNLFRAPSSVGPFSEPTPTSDDCTEVEACPAVETAQQQMPALPLVVPPFNVKAALLGVPLANGKCYASDHRDFSVDGFIGIGIHPWHSEPPRSLAPPVYCELNPCCSCPEDGESIEGCNQCQVSRKASKDDNILSGSWYLVDPENNFATGGALVHIEADEKNSETSEAGEYTFHGRSVNWAASDHHEPLASTFAARYLQNPMFSGGTDLIVWRDPKEIIEPFDCDQGPPPPFPLGQEAIIVFDENENPDIPAQLPISPQPEVSGLDPFPWATQRVTVGGPDFPVPFSSGWIYLNLNAGDIDGNPPEDPFASQNWVVVLASAEGRFSVGFDALALDSTCNANHLDPDENPAIGGSGDDDAIP